MRRSTSSLASPDDDNRVPSVPASLHSNEADDERSPSVRSAEEEPRMDATPHGAKPSYPGEDVRMTSSKELWGWYSYGWASEVFVVCGVGSFIPITLEQLAREQGVLLSDRTTPCKTGIDTNPPNLNNTLANRAPPGHADRSSQCVVYFLGSEVNTASFAMYTFSISVLIQALVIISMSGAADHGRYRKSLLLGFAVTGAIVTMLFLPVTSNVYVIAAFFAIVANVSFGASFVLLNSFLPLLVRHHPKVRAPIVLPEAGVNGHTVVYEEPFADDVGSNRELDDSTSTLLPHDGQNNTIITTKIPATSSLELQLSTKISSNGIGIGYIAAVLVQILSVVIIQMTGGSTFSLRLVLFVVGAWWFIFTIPAAAWLRPRPGPPLKTGEATSKQNWTAYLGFAWKSLGRTIMRARRLKDMLLFLSAWFLLSDGIATVSGTAVLFAKTSLGMKPAALALINVVVMISGVIGAFCWSRCSRFFGLQPSGTILACILCFELIPIYALLGYIPALRRFGAFGLQQPWEMYPVGAVYGLVLGGLSSYCRSLFGELIPPGFEASFYALYAITDKGSSVFGPAIVAAITDRTGDIRPAFWFLAVLIGLPFPLMWFVDVQRGRAKAAEVSKEIQGKRVQHLGDDET